MPKAKALGDRLQIPHQFNATDLLPSVLLYPNQLGMRLETPSEVKSLIFLCKDIGILLHH